MFWPGPKPGRTFQGYGAVTEEQAGECLENNENLQEQLKQVYKDF